MEFQCLTSHLKYLESAAVTLSIHERMQLDLALAQLCDQLNFEHMFFWGRITGKFAHHYLNECPELPELIDNRFVSCRCGLGLLHRCRHELPRT